MATQAVFASPTHDQGFAINLRKKSTRQEFKRALAQCKPEDFDGHTEFYRLTPEQRLEWLCQAATFVQEFKGKAHRAAKRARESTEELMRRVHIDSCSHRPVGGRTEQGRA